MSNKNKNFLEKPDQAFLDLLIRTNSPNKAEAIEALQQIAKAIEVPLRKGMLVGDITGGIFSKMLVAPGSSTEFPLDLLAPGEEVDFVAYTNPGHGRIPERAVEGDYIMVPTYMIASAIDWLLRYAREARWDIVERATRVLEAGFVKKINDDAWHTLLSAGVDRNILVYDADAQAGQFTKRLVSLMKTVMRRNAGGNSGSINRGKLTDMFMSPEGVEDIRNWGVDLVDDTTRREIYLSTDDGSITRLFGVNLHALDEFGENQEYQRYFTSSLSGALGPSSDVELVIGLDLSTNDSFLMPIKQEVTLYADEMMHRQGRAGIYGSAELGFAVLDNRRVLVGSF
jgi:hypothetical protein